MKEKVERVTGWQLRPQEFWIWKSMSIQQAFSAYSLGIFIHKPVWIIDLKYKTYETKKCNLTKNKNALHLKTIRLSTVVRKMNKTNYNLM